MIVAPAAAAVVVVLFEYQNRTKQREKLITVIEFTEFHTTNHTRDLKLLKALRLSHTKK